MSRLTTNHYVPILRLKTGERHAYCLLSRTASERTRPQWVVPPRSQRDLDEGRFLNPYEYVTLTGKRLASVSAGSECYVDLRFALKGFPESEIGNSIVSLFRLVSDTNARPIPVIDVITYDATFLSAISIVAKQNRIGAAIRLDIEAMQDSRTEDRTRTILQLIDVRPMDVTILLDFEDAQLDDDDDSAAIVEEAYDRISSRFPWHAVVQQATSYPLKNPAGRNSIFAVMRPEFPLWRRLQLRAKQSGRVIVFGDYGADNSEFLFDGQGRPSPHLRYSTENSWQVSRGDKTVERSVTMRSTASRISALAEFKGDGYSWGDSMIVDMAAGEMTGNPTTWRSINTSHHLEATCRDISSTFGVSLPQYSLARRGVQAELDI